MHEEAADSPAFPTGSDKEGANSGSIGCRIEQRVLPDSMVVAALEGLASAPTAAGNDQTLRLHHEIGAVADELCIDAIDGA